MEPLPTPARRGTRLTLVALALFLLLAPRRVREPERVRRLLRRAPVDDVFQLGVLGLPRPVGARDPAAAVGDLPEAEAGGRETRARASAGAVLQNLLTLGFFIGVTAFFVYIRHLHPNVFGPRGEKLNAARKGVKAAGSKQQPYDPAFQWPVAFGAVAIGLVLAVTAFVLHRRRKRRLANAAPRERMEIVEELVAEIGDAIDDLEAEPDARRAVIAAYARMEAALGRHGVRRRPSETPYEYLARVLLELEVPADAVRALTDAFERAKFSPHEIDVRGKRTAIGALVAVRAGLQAATA